MELLESLGVNSSIFAQLVIFLIAYVLLSRIAFKPYLEALNKRDANTVGGEETAEKLNQEVESLKKEFDEKAKEMSLAQMEIYNSAQAEAQKTYDSLVAQERKNSEDSIESMKTKVKKNIGEARGQMSSEVPKVSQEIIGKLIGKKI